MTKVQTVSPISEVIQKDRFIVSCADHGISLCFPTLGFALQRSPHVGLQPVHDDLNRPLGLVLEQLEQRPGVTLHASACDKDRDGLERIGEHVPLAGTVGRSRPFRAKDDSPGLGQGLVKGVERMAPQKEGGCVEGKALEQVLYVYGSVGRSTARDEIEGLSGSLLKDVEVRDAFLCEERTGDLAALDEGVEVSFGKRAGKKLCTHDSPPISFAGER